MKQKFEASARRLLRSPIFWSLSTFLFVAVASLAVVFVDQGMPYGMMFAEGTALGFIGAAITVPAEVVAFGRTYFSTFSYVLLATVVVDALLLLFFALGRTKIRK